MGTVSEGIMLMWFILTGMSILFVIFDIPNTPAHPVIKWAFIILVIFSGPLGAFFYVLGCREPLNSTHQEYIAAPWRQVLGSTMHCAAGDGIGIIAGAAIATLAHFSEWTHLIIEYGLGFGFGWGFFQAFAMRDMVGGSYMRSLKLTFLPEFLSMNLLMAGMIVIAKLLMPWIVGSDDPFRPGFWFVMSMALIAGFILAYPMNWWLVQNGLKHGMLTVRKGEKPAHEEHEIRHETKKRPSKESLAGMAALSILILAAGVTIWRLISV